MKKIIFKVSAGSKPGLLFSSFVISAMPLTAKSPGYIGYIYRQRSGEYFNGFESGKSVFWGVLVMAAVFLRLSNDKCCIFKCFKFSTVFLGLYLVTS